MPEINLLPQGFKPKGYILKLANSLNKFAIISLAIVTAAVSVFLGAILFLSQRTRESIKNQETTKSQISALEQTEQRLFLVKDRIQKVEKVLAFPSSGEEKETFNEIIRIIPQSIKLKGVTIGKESTRFGIAAGSLSEITGFLASLGNIPGLKRVSLNSFQFNPLVGYTMELEVER